MVESLFGWLRGAIRRPGLGCVVTLLVVITIPHYAEGLRYPGFLADWLLHFGLDRQAFERIAYLVPIIWAGILLGQRAAFVTSLVALACMVPQAISSSVRPMNALFETGAVFVLGNTVSFSFEALRRERSRRADLEQAQSALQTQLRVIRENEKRLTALNQTTAILSQSLGLEQVLDKATVNVCDVMQVEACLVYLVDEQAVQLRLAAYRGVSSELARKMDRIAIGDGFSGRIAQTGEPLLVQDTSLETGLVGESTAVREARSLLGVPMKSKGKVTGTLCVLAYSQRGFVSSDTDLLTAIANQVGIAIEDARLYEKERLAIERLAVSERNYRGLFENAIDAIWVHDPDGNITVANRASEK
ncbi:MAG: GAF domain-containing protein, partial [Chloroflexi bacterium]|nr:GAF domain-containing protein [Chloroflexota bacterium]